MGAKCVIITTARQTDRQTKKNQGLTQCYVALGVRVDYNQLLGGERERERERERLTDIHKTIGLVSAITLNAV